MDLFDKGLYRANKFFLTICGLWPYQSFISKLIALPIIMYSLLILLVPQAIYIIQHRTDLDALLETMPICLAGVIFGIKLISTLCKSKEMRILINQLHENWVCFSDEKDIETMNKYAREGRMFTLIYTLTLCGIVIMYAVMPLSAPILDVISPLNESRPKKMPHPSEYFIDQEKYYYPLLFSTYPSYLLGPLVIFCIDSLLVVFLWHICGMFAILSHRLDKLSRIDTSVKEKELQQRIINCIELHIRTIKFANLVESTFSIVYLVDIAVGIILLSICCVMVTISLGRPAEMTRYGLSIVAKTFRLAFNSWVGEKLIIHSVTVSSKIYATTWYQMPMKSSRLLQFFLMRSQIPCTMSIGHIYDMNMSNFAMVMKTSLSYCTMVASVRETAKNT